MTTYEIWGSRYNERPERFERFEEEDPSKARERYRKAQEDNSFAHRLSLYEIQKSIETVEQKVPIEAHHWND
ncbi:MAG: hypothetical protein WAZ27_02840 [Minisyncoccia bacterium]